MLRQSLGVLVKYTEQRKHKQERKTQADSFHNSHLVALVFTAWKQRVGIDGRLMYNTGAFLNVDSKDEL